MYIYSPKNAPATQIHYLCLNDTPDGGRDRLESMLILTVTQFEVCTFDYYCNAYHIIGTLLRALTRLVYLPQYTLCILLLYVYTHVILYIYVLILGHPTGRLFQGTTILDIRKEQKYERWRIG